MVSLFDEIRFAWLPELLRSYFSTMVAAKIFSIVVAFGFGV